MRALNAPVLSFLLMLASGGLFSACSSGGYYGQALGGHLNIVRRQKPIADLLAAPSTPEDLRRSLEMVLELRGFAAKQLALPVDGHYTRYADLERRFVVWNVHAAPEFSLKARTWWYPMVGRLKYRGYFSESAAQRIADRLAARGEDVYLGGVEAYSTLGWFRDPVLNTFVHHKPGDLAEILFHELTHQRLFISGDTDFNEAFATAVAQEGTRRWLRQSGRVEDLERYERWLAQERQFVSLVQGARRELEHVYQAGTGRGNEQTLRAAKAVVMDRLRESHRVLKEAWGGKSPYDRWFAMPLNNAQLNTVATYYDLVPGFERMLREQGGDLPRFYEAVKRLGKLGKERRRAELLR